MLYQHTNGNQAGIKKPEYDITIHIKRGTAIVNRKTGRKRIIDRAMTVQGRDPQDISMELEFEYDLQTWRVGEDDCEVIL